MVKPFEKYSHGKCWPKACVSTDYMDKPDQYKGTSGKLQKILHKLELKHQLSVPRC